MSSFVEMLCAGPKGLNSTYRPEAGTVCLISGPNCDNDEGYVFSEFTVLWSNDIFVLYGNEGFWPNLYKWDHVIAKEITLLKPSA